MLPSEYKKGSSTAQFMIYQEKGFWWVKKITPEWLDILGPFYSEEEASKFAVD